jgi:hypothetical protein
LPTGSTAYRPSAARIYDWPTIRDRLGTTARPNAILERQLEIQLRELGRQAKPEAGLEAEAEIEM